MKNKRSLNERGITLVSLIITIIILLILAGISIQAIKNQGLFAQVQEAKRRTENAQQQEDEMLEKYLSQINNFVFKNVDKTETDPEAAMPYGAYVIEGNADKGIVIRDSNENEWAWVETPKKTVFTTATNTNDYDNIKADLIEYAKDYRSKFWTDEWYAISDSTLVTENTDGLTETQKQLNNGCGLTYYEYQTAYKKMLSSIYTYGGFWISRYEIGDSTATINNSIRTSNSGTTGIAVSKINQIPYNYVTCAQAQLLANGMSPDVNKTSSLLFGIQWDLTCKFLEEKSDLTKDDIKSDSTSWGNYKNSSLNLTRGKYNIASDSLESIWKNYNIDTENYVVNLKTLSSENYSQLLTTGASEQTNKLNIYDLAGNEWEWTLENTHVETHPCAHRGGRYNVSGFQSSVASRDYNPTTLKRSDLSFRVTLY